MGVKTKRLLLKGVVQNVTFRAFAKQNASRMGLCGYAKNLRNGDLEIVVQGDERKMVEFVKLCRRGPLFAKISSIQEFEIESEEEFDFFDIRFS